MNPYVLRALPEAEVTLFHKIKRVIDLLPDLETESEGGTLISCHTLARVIGKHFGLKVETGKYHEIYEHSWLRTPGGRIIDVYPVATLGGPLLIDCRLLLSQLYRTASVRSISRGDFSQKFFLRSLRRIDRAVRTILKDITSEEVVST